MGSNYRVKGSTLNTKFAYVRERFGEAAEGAMRAQFDDGELFPILDADWYPYSLYIEILQLIADRHFEGNIAKLVDVGDYSAGQALTSVYQAFVRGDEFTQFLGRMSALHRLLYSLGRVEVRLWQDGDGCEIWHQDKPEHAEQDLHVALGFYLRAAKLHGLGGVSGAFSIEDEGAQFTITWSRAV